MAKRILLIGGGTGGHVFPLIAVAESIRKLDPSAEILAIGDGPFIAKATSEAGIPFKPLFGGKIRRYFSALNFLDLLKFPFSFLQSLWTLYRYMPDVVFAKGTFSSIAPCLVAKLYFIPVYIHESDSVPGRSNMFLGQVATKAFTSFESAVKYFNQGKVVLVGNPVRPEVLVGNRDTALEYFNFRADMKTIFVYGGSQGSKHINDLILESLVQLVKDYQVIHQCGDSQLQAVKGEVDRLSKEGENSYGPMISANYRLYPFVSAEELAMAYAMSDIVISRGGASNLFEIATGGKPAIIIPITDSHGNHQSQNAVEFAKYGAVIIEEANTSPHILINQIQNLLEPSTYTTVSDRIKTVAKPDAADQIASALLH